MPESRPLKVPGATLYFEVRGSGPLLLTISGGPADAGAFTGLAACLADRYTVVSYDPRGNSRSRSDFAPVEQDLDVHGDDAARLIQSFGAEPAFVLGNSGGAQIGLNLAARHPARVHTLVAHEPPCIRVLPDPSDEIAATHDIHATFLREGIGAAMQKFAALAGMGPPGPPARPPTPEEIETFGRMSGNIEYFVAHGLRPISLYAPDIAALRSGSARVVVGIGEESKGQLCWRTSTALAEKLGSKPVLFPGDHMGYGPHPERFAEVLDAVLRGG
jgi:pimeloyl-ACP methyl ester carboxylesterase